MTVVARLMGHEIEGQTFGNYSDGLALKGLREGSNQPRRLVATLEVGLRLTQTHVQAHLGDYIRVITPDTRGSTYGSLTYLVGGYQAELAEPI